MNASAEAVLSERLLIKPGELPPGRLAEVEAFVDFLRERSADRKLVHAAGRASEGSFTAAWDNPDDAAYDAL